MKVQTERRREIQSRLRESVETVVQTLARWPELSKALQAQTSKLRRLGQELRFVEALLQARPDVIDGGKELWQKAVEETAAGIDAGKNAATLVAEVESLLAPFQPVVKEYTIHCVGHAHIDMNWQWSWPETVEICHDTFTTVNRLMEEFPDFRFSQSQGSTYYAMEQESPEIFEMIKRRVASGQWEVTANLWVEGDKNLASGEALCRQILLSKRYFRDRFDLPYDKITLDFEPDTFGHAWTVPQILRNAGIERYYFCRAGKEHQLFWWEAPDGSRVLAWNDSKLWYLGPVRSEHAVEVLRLEQATGMKDYMVLYGVGDHGGGPTRRDLQLVKEMQEWPIWPNYRFGTLDEFFALAEKVGDRLPVVRDELNFVFRGCYTSQSNIKRANRFSENMLVRAESLASVAHAMGWLDYPHEAFNTGWRNTCFNQFHDILPGSGVRGTYDYAQGLFQETQTKASMSWKKAAEQLVGRLPRPQAGRPIVVFNSQPWERTEGVTAKVFNIPRNTRAVTLKDEDGKIVPAQVSGGGHYWGHEYVDVSWTAADVPGMGYRSFFMERSPADQNLLGLAVDPTWLGDADRAKGTDAPVFVAGDGRMHNEYFKIQVEPGSGSIVSLIDRQTGEELVPAGARLGLFQVAYETPHGMSSWVVGPITRTTELLQGGRMNVAEAGPGRAVLRTQHSFGDSRLSVDIILARGVPRVDFLVRVDWLEVGGPHKDSPMLKMVFPVALEESRALFEVPFGSIEREQTGEEVPTQQWVGLQGNAASGKPYSVAVLNDYKYGCDVSDSTVRMTLLRASYDPDPYPELGRHEMRFALVARPDEVSCGEFTRWGQEFNNPLSALTVYSEGTPQTGAIATARTEGVVESLAARGGFLTVGPDNVGFAALKVAEDSSDVVLRIFETDGKAVTARLEPGWEVAQVLEADTLEQPLPCGTKYTPQDGVVEVPLEPYEIKTLLLQSK